MSFDLSGRPQAPDALSAAADQDIVEETNILQKLLVQARRLTLPASFLASLVHAVDLNAKLRRDMDALLQEGRPTRVLLASQQQQMKRLRDMLQEATKREHQLHEEKDELEEELEQLQERLQEAQAAAREAKEELATERSARQAAQDGRRQFEEKLADSKRLLASRRELAISSSAGMM